MSTSNKWMFVVMILICGGLGYLPLTDSVPIIIEGESTASWTARTCTIVVNDYLKPGNERADSANFRYEYSVGGGRYAGTRWAVGAGRGSERLALEAKSLPVGSEHTVYVNPKDPAKSVLSQGYDRFVALFYFLLGLFFVALGVVGLYRLVVTQVSGQVEPIVKPHEEGIGVVCEKCGAEHVIPDEEAMQNTKIRCVKCSATIYWHSCPKCETGWSSMVKDEKCPECAV